MVFAASPWSTHFGMALALIATGVSLGGCATSQDHAGTGNAGSASAPTAAMAATFRYLAANNASALKSAAATYCIGVGTRPDLADPSAELLDALADVRPQVRPVSSCRMGPHVVDTAGRPALIFNLAPAGCDGADNCLFAGGYYEGNLSASGGSYRARRVNGAWRVTPEGPQAIS